jgi:competence protein ComEA
VFDLTPGERRGAFVLLALCALGAGWDLWHGAPRPAPPAESLSPATTLAPAPAPSAPAGIAPARGVAPQGAELLDLNTATAADLDRLPGIGPVLAGRIVAQRAAHGPFRDPADLLAVRGVGPRLWERLRPLVRVGRTVPRAPLQIATPADH